MMHVQNNVKQFKKGADMREDIMYVIVYPDGLIVMNTQKYFKIQTLHF